MKFFFEFHHCCLLASPAAAAEEEETSVVPAIKYSCERNGLISSSSTSGYRHWRPGLSVISEKDVVSFSNATSKKKSSVNDHSKASTKPKSMMAKARSSYGHRHHNNFHNRNGTTEMMIPGFAPAPFIF